MSNIKIQQVKSSSDINEVHNIAQELWTEHFSEMYSPKQLKYMMSKYQSADEISQQMGSWDYSYYMIYKKYYQAGYFAIQRVTDILKIRYAFLYPEYRGSGIGHNLLEILKLKAEQEHCSSIQMACPRQDAKTFAILLHEGFVILDERSRDIGSGYKLNEYIMSYTIK